MNKITWQGVAVGVILGVVFASQIRRIPGVSKIPTA